MKSATCITSLCWEHCRVVILAACPPASIPSWHHSPWQIGLRSWSLAATYSVCAYVHASKCLNTYPIPNLGAVYRYFESRRRIVNDAKPGRQERVSRNKKEQRKRQSQRNVSSATNQNFCWSLECCSTHLVLTSMQIFVDLTIHRWCSGPRKLQKF